ncbi:MAG: hypothetical protein HY560_13825 [Gemmatimonadetes bacterium]|nr:hypothetical protein [Gemmatimonadota bacterium]
MRKAKKVSEPMPLASPHLARKAAVTLLRAAAVGMLPGGTAGAGPYADLRTVRRLAARLRREGLARAAAAELMASTAPDARRLEAILGDLDEALAHSPLPSHEWKECERVLGADLLGRLLGLSPSSVRRYAAGTRRTPDPIADHLHFLALIIGDLAGTYNALGVRRWFTRHRHQLGGRSPAQILSDDWTPEGSGPLQVRQLAESLLASSGT